MRHEHTFIAALLLGATSLTPAADAADLLRPSYAPSYGETLQAPAETRAFSIGVEIGATSIEARETLHFGAHKNSELIWTTDNAPTINVILKGTAGGLQTRLRGSFAVQSDSYMEDYDWLGNFAEYGLATYDWTHRSQHDATTLDRAINLDAQVGARVFGNRHAGLSLLGGVRHTDVQWTAYGGKYVYSSPFDGVTSAADRFRNRHFTIPDSEKGVTYQQHYTSPYIGVGAGFAGGGFSLRGAGYVGVPLFTAGTDDHWHRFFRANSGFDDTYMLGVEAEAGYDFTDRLGVTASLRHERYGQGGSDVYATSHLGLGYDVFEGHEGGGDHRQTHLGVGARYKF